MDPARKEARIRATRERIEGLEERQQALREFAAIVDKSDRIDRAKSNSEARKKLAHSTERRGMIVVFFQ
ncbi:hypothetical protein KY285_001178 [Solanum tuberosum]|nr:hypothetical protein KY285_001178 [Solanum tuberosum]